MSYNPEAEEHVRKLVKAFDKWNGTVFSVTAKNAPPASVHIDESPELTEFLNELQNLHDEGVVILRGVDGP